MLNKDPKFTTSMSSFNDIPFLSPPPGQVTNFENPESRALAITIICSICLALMWPVFLMRIYAKVWVIRAFGWDDGQSAGPLYWSLLKRIGSVFYTCYCEPCYFNAGWTQAEAKKIGATSSAAAVIWGTCPNHI